MAAEEPAMCPPPDADTYGPDDGPDDEAAE
jgi:hypothetical protein